MDFGGFAQLHLELLARRTQKKFKIPDPSEAQIEHSILQYLDLKAREMGFLFWKHETRGDLRKRFGAYRTPNPFTLRGIPDIILVFEGLFVGIEVKSRKGRQSESQKEFQQRLEDCGGRYFIVRSLNDVQAVLKDLHDFEEEE